VTPELIITSILLGAGLAMDAFSVSLADGLGERELNTARALTIAGTFAMFQFAMPVAGWLLVHTAAERFTAFQACIPWIALILLLYIGGKMLIEGIRESRNGGNPGEGDAAETTARSAHLSAGDLMVQGVATSIDALSVGFTIAAYSAGRAIMSSVIIGIVTLIICIAGLYLGRSIGTRLSGRASILGGVILIAIGIEIWAKGLFF
jgi:putative Mn2+ efflux pump MntP